MKRVAVAVVGAVLATGLVSGVGFGASSPNKSTPNARGKSRHGASHSVNRTTVIDNNGTVTTTETHGPNANANPNARNNPNPGLSPACARAFARVNHLQLQQAKIAAKDPNSPRVAALGQAIIKALQQAGRICNR